MANNVTLKSLFESNKGELQQKLSGLKLPQNANKIQQVIAEYLNELCDSNGEFRQNLTQSEDYILQAAMSLLNAQLEMCNVLSKQGLNAMKNESKAESSASSESEASPSDEKKQNILNIKMTSTEAMIGSAGGALVGNLVFNGWGAVFGAIAGTAVAVYVASRTGKKAKKNEETPATNPLVQRKELPAHEGTPLEVDELLSIISGICDSVDRLVDTFRAQINRVISKYENKEKPSIEKDYRPLLESIQLLVGYNRTHGEDEKYAKKVNERIEDLAEMLDNYRLSVVNYSVEHDAWFEKVSSPNTTQPKMVYPAIVKEGNVVLMGKMFVPEN